jgi:hypothetical protein
LAELPIETGCGANDKFDSFDATYQDEAILAPFAYA